MQRYKEMLVASSADDILLTKAFTGLQTNMLRPVDRGRRSRSRRPARARRHRYRQGHRHRRARKPPKALEGYLERGALDSGVSEILSVDEMIARTIAEYREADQRLAAALTHDPAEHARGPVDLLLIPRGEAEKQALLVGPVIRHAR